MIGLMDRAYYEEACRIHGARWDAEREAAWAEREAAYIARCEAKYEAALAEREAAWTEREAAWAEREAASRCEVVLRSIFSCLNKRLPDSKISDEASEKLRQIDDPQLLEKILDFSFDVPTMETFEEFVANLT